jgi:hypothetical protein
MMLYSFIVNIVVLYTWRRNFLKSYVAFQVDFYFWNLLLYIVQHCVIKFCEEGRLVETSRILYIFRFRLSASRVRLFRRASNIKNQG